MSSRQSDVRLEAVGALPDQAMAALPPIYGGSHWSTSRTRQDYSYRYAATGGIGMTFRTSRMQGSITGDIPPGDDYVVQWITAGHALVDVNGDAVRLQLGRPLLFPAHRPFVFQYTDYDQKLVHLDRNRVAEVAAECLDLEPGPLRFDHRRTPTAASAAAWMDAVALAYRSLARGDISDLLWHEVTRMTIVAFLEMYPPETTALSSAVPATGEARIRRVVEHIHANPELPLTTSRLAELVDVSARTLQDSFARQLGASPMAYLRRVRLERVREDLLAATPDAVTVGDVATRWGFAHLGRFSVEYRRRFGEKPSETLRG
jgi:AraC-like DNA-binding protein